MKKFFKSLFFFSLVGVSMFSASCSDDETTVEPVLPPEDGVYVVGGTFLPTISLNGKLEATLNEANGQTARTELLDGYVYLTAGEFSIIKVEGATQTTYNAGADFVSVTTQINDEPKPEADYKRGSVSTTSTTKFSVSADGLYHVAIDLGVMKAVVVPVTHWNFIGAATPAGWSDDVANKMLPTVALPAVNYEVKNLKLVKGEFKLRHSSAWKVTVDSTYDNGNGNKGIKINTNYGKSLTELVPGGDNIVSTYNGFYTATMTYTAGSGFVAAVVKTGDVVQVDYSTYAFGIIGNAYYLADGTTAASWNENWGGATETKTPTKAGSVYTWKWSGVKMINAGEWKIRQDSNWDGKSIGYGVDSWTGADKGDFSNNGGNIKVTNTADTKYDITLTIDAATELYTLDAVKSAVQ